MTDTTPGPAGQEEAERLAVQCVQQYLSACRMTHRDQIANRMMKLCSVAGAVMAHAEGSALAAERLHATAEFIAKTMPACPAKMEPVQ